MTGPEMPRWKRVTIAVLITLGFVTFMICYLWAVGFHNLFSIVG